MRLCLFSCSPTDFCLGMLHFPLPRCVTDGFSCRQTITAEAFGCIPFVLVWGNKILLWKLSCFMRASLFVLGLFVVCRSHEKRIFTEQINFIGFLTGPHGQPFKWLQPLKPLLSLIIQRNFTAFFYFIILMFFGESVLWQWNVKELFIWSFPRWFLWLSALLSIKSRWAADPSVVDT